MGAHILLFKKIILTTRTQASSIEPTHPVTDPTVTISPGNPDFSTLSERCRPRHVYERNGSRTMTYTRRIHVDRRVRLRFLTYPRTVIELSD